ncbi:MAG: DUF4248 domain-containing protein [Bacteroidaceae bacterium]|nr:DUF4248 domain-containing protein [Bacteroidaceae bacterium]
MEKDRSVAEQPFIIRPYLKSELAGLYNPELSAVYALRKLRGWINHNDELREHFYTERESKKDVAFSKRQVRMLVEILGEP